MCVHLQQLRAHMQQHGGADAQQAVRAPGRVAEQRVPQPHSVREGELLRSLTFSASLQPQQHGPLLSHS